MPTGLERSPVEVQQCPLISFRILLHGNAGHAMLFPKFSSMRNLLTGQRGYLAIENITIILFKWLERSHTEPGLGRRTTGMENPGPASSPSCWNERCSFGKPPSVKVKGPGDLAKFHVGSVSKGICLPFKAFISNFPCKTFI